jgi:biopolymer transport protein ExbD
VSLRGRSRRRGGRPLNAEVNIINLVDVMLVLLIIFMVTAPILQSGIVVRLPRSSAHSNAPSETVTITVQRDGQIAVGDTRQSWNEFTTSFPILVNTRHPAGVNLRSDAGTPMGDVVRVLDLVRRAGVDKINLVTEQAGS